MYTNINNQFSGYNGFGPVTETRSRFCQDLFTHYDPQVLDAFKAEMTYGMERFFLLTFCLACCWPGPGRADLRVVRQWADLAFVFPNETTRLRAMESRYYVPGNSVPIDVDVQHRTGSVTSRIFVTIPRFDEGRPVTLGTVDELGQISAYPSYEWHDNQGFNCDGLTSVFRVAIDKCSRMWVMDAGKIGDHQVCPPQLLAFDLTTDTLIYRHRVNASQYIPSSLFITPVVDVRGRGPGDCQDTFVYVADVNGFGLLVVDVANDRSWRVTHRLFYPFPSWGTFTIDRENFDLMDGVLGMALSPEPRSPRGERYLYFHSLAAVTENVVRTNVLRNDSFINNNNADPNSMNVFPQERPNQAAAEAMDRDGIMYFGLMDPPSIWCWNSATVFAPHNFHPIAINQETLQFASGVKVVTNLLGEQELWALTSSFQRVMTGSLNSANINFRIHAEKIDRLLGNLPCRSPPKHRAQGYHANLITPTNPKRVSFRYGVASSL